MAVSGAKLVSLEDLKAFNDDVNARIAEKWKEYSYQRIFDIVRAGDAEKHFSIGDQIIMNWEDTAAGTTYEMPFNVVHFDTVTLEDGTTTPGMFLQQQYETPFGVQFDAQEAWYVPEATMAAGTYNFTIDSTWGKAAAGTYQFTLTKEVPAGYQIGGLETIADVEPANWKVKVYSGPDSNSPVETVSVTSGSEGTSLGRLIPAGDGTLNSIQRTYGYNRWAQSGIRQWLNSDKTKGNWWSAQNKFDRAPSELTTKDGYLVGFDQDFLALLRAIKVTTAKNTVTDDGTNEDTYDKIFLPSIEQMYGSPQVSGDEGAYWEYWKEATGLSSPSNAENEGRIMYPVNSKTSAANCRLRSAYRSGALGTWYDNTSGAINGNYAYGSSRCAPALCIS